MSSKSFPVAVHPDADVLDLIERGERTQALRLLMNRYGDQVARYCRAAIGDVAQADDVLQRVFIEVHRDMHKYSGRSAIKAWIFGIARHRVLDHNRDAQRGRKRQRPMPREVVDPTPPLSDRLDKARLTQALEDCLQEVGEHVRAALVLRYQQGFSFEEMAEICGEKAGTLQARVARALPVLRDCIEGRREGSI